MWCTAKVGDGYSAIAGAHKRHITTRSPWSTSLFPHVVVELLFWWYHNNAPHEQFIQKSQNAINYL